MISKKNVSAIIAHNDARGSEMLNACIASIKSQGVRDIIVECKGNKSEARNAAAARAKGNILIFFDDDIVLRCNCINELLEPFSRMNNIGIVGGVNIAFPDEEPAQQASSTLLASPVTMMKSASRYTPRGNIRFSDESEILSCVMAVSAEAFNEAGGFPIDVIPCEENVLVNKIEKLGYDIIYNPFAVVYHHRPKMFVDYWKRLYSYGFGRGLMTRKKLGNPRMFWTPSASWILYGIAIIGHYISYISGFIVGYAYGERKKVPYVSDTGEHNNEHATN